MKHVIRPRRALETLGKDGRVGQAPESPRARTVTPPPAESAEVGGVAREYREFCGLAEGWRGLECRPGVGGAG
ncbi:hypothetical protein C5B95_09685 [Rathayibacter sp. AY1A7]|nr:hypothetical protein C5B95_09685 [Rathayibacter sp. AY1A7]